MASSDSVTSTAVPKTADAPVKTIAKGKALLRSGSPDHLLLKRGDVWGEAIGKWSLSGRNEQEPMLIGAYGTGARPVLKTGTATGLDTNGRAVHDVAVIGLHFTASARDPGASSFVGSAGGSYGLRVIGHTDGFLLEDSVVDHYRTNVTFGEWDGRATDVTVTDQLVILDGKDSAGDREKGWGETLDKLVGELARG